MAQATNLTEVSSLGDTCKAHEWALFPAHSFFPCWHVKLIPSSDGVACNRLNQFNKIEEKKCEEKIIF